jgi:hypothetical protein
VIAYADSAAPRSILEAKATNTLDARVLSGIFTFAATPERQNVRCQV